MFKVFGHRGAISAAGGGSQNSLAAFQTALTHADGFETDACLSADGEVFLIHEARYVSREVEYCLEEYLDEESRKLVAGRRLEQMPSAEVKRLRLLGGEPIPTLDQALRLFHGRPDKQLNIELKGCNSAGPVLERLERAFSRGEISRQQIILSSFNFAALRDVRRLNRDLSLGMLFVGPDVRSVPLYPGLEGGESSGARYTPLAFADLDARAIAEISPQFVVIPHHCAELGLDRRFREVFASAQLIVWVFTELDNFDPAAFSRNVRELDRRELLYAVIVDNPAWRPE